MSKKPGPAKHTKESGSSVAASQPNRSEHAMSNSEITSLIEKKISEALSKQATQLQLQEVSSKLQQLSEEFRGASKGQSQRVEETEKALGSLQQSYAHLERKLKWEIDEIVEEKVRWIQQKVQSDPGAGRYIDQGRCSDQSSNIEVAHQAELLKLHQQHHQDMLSVINDCCGKLKSGFTRQHKPYEVSEIHSVIDDIEQKMVSEILSEIQKTNTNEDLSPFEEALECAKPSRELGEAKDDAVKTTPRMTSVDISSALETFENETSDNWAEELKPTKNSVGEELFEGPQEPIDEEEISKSRGIITGDRGNPYYAEELKMAVDGMMSVTGDTEPKHDSVDLTTSGPPPKTRTRQDIEASLDSMIITDSSSDASQPKTKADNLPDKKSLVSDIVVPESPSEIFKKDLASIDALTDADFGAGSSPDAFTNDLRSLDARIATELEKSQVPPPSSSSSQHSKPLDAKVATDSKGSTVDQGQFPSLEGKLESDINKEAAAKVKGDATVKKPSPTKDQVQADQPQGASTKHEKQPTKETPTQAVSKDSAKRP